MVTIKKLHTDAYIHQLYANLKVAAGNPHTVKLALAWERLLIKVGDVYSVGY